MGLDITAYSGIKRVDVDHLCDEVIDNAYKDGNAYLWVNESFPEQGTGLENGVFSYKERYSFRAGSYGGYNDFRRHLARSAGYEDRAAWGEGHEFINSPYYWMVNFSDCEGLINAAHSARLAREFEEGEKRWQSYLASDVFEGFDEWYNQRYQDWRRAFILASDNGVVQFH